MSGHGMVFIASLSSPSARQVKKYTFLLPRNVKEELLSPRKSGMPVSEKNRCGDGLVNEQGGMVFDKKTIQCVKALNEP